jgi:hypothetical protein
MNKHLKNINLQIFIKPKLRAICSSIIQVPVLFKYRHYSSTGIIQVHVLFKYLYYSNTCIIQVPALFKYLYYSSTCIIQVPVLLIQSNIDEKLPIPHGTKRPVRTLMLIATVVLLFGFLYIFVRFLCFSDRAS